MPTKRNVCFVTGTRAEFGLMRSTLQAICAHPALRLQLVVTGMHLHAAHGRSIDAIREEGWNVDAVVKWARGDASPASNAANTGRAMAALARTFQRLKADVVLVVGDRVEAFAAASAAHVSHLPLAHVHGGDRALGQIDDSLRHAITKLAHVHFPATAPSARRLRRLGEDRWRIRRVGSPGVDGIRETAATWEQLAREFPGLKPRRYALLVLHPTGADERQERMRAKTLARAVASTGFDRAVIVYPNNDPGSGGVIRCWDELEGKDDWVLRRDLARPLFLGLLRDAAVLAGNSSSGIIEAASFSTPVLDVGPRQAGRERSGNVKAVPFSETRIRGALAGAWNGGKPQRSRAKNVYGGGGTGRRIARILARVQINDRLLRKLVTY